MPLPLSLSDWALILVRVLLPALRPQFLKSHQRKVSQRCHKPEKQLLDRRNAMAQSNLTWCARIRGPHTATVRAWGRLVSHLLEGVGSQV